MELYLLIGLAVLAGLVVALRRIAPLTKNTVDDRVLSVAEKAQAAADLLKPKR